MDSSQSLRTATGTCVLSLCCHATAPTQQDQPFSPSSLRAAAWGPLVDSHSRLTTAASAGTSPQHTTTPHQSTAHYHTTPVHSTPSYTTHQSTAHYHTTPVNSTLPHHTSQQHTTTHQSTTLPHQSTTHYQPHQSTTHCHTPVHSTLPHHISPQHTTTPHKFTAHHRVSLEHIIDSLQVTITGQVSTTNSKLESVITDGDGCMCPVTLLPRNSSDAAGPTILPG